MTDNFEQYYGDEEEYDYEEEENLDYLDDCPEWEPYTEEDYDEMFSFAPDEEYEEDYPDDEEESSPQPEPVEKIEETSTDKTGKKSRRGRPKKEVRRVAVEIPRESGDEFRPVPKKRGRRGRSKKEELSIPLKEFVLNIYDALPLSKREGQRYMLETMADEIDAARVNKDLLIEDMKKDIETDISIVPYKLGAAEAPVGTGKSYVLLLLAFGAWYLYGKRTVISTFTKVLQNQLYTKDIPNFINLISGLCSNKSLGLDRKKLVKWSYGIVKGRENYICPLILDRYMDIADREGDMIFKSPGKEKSPILVSWSRLSAIRESIRGAKDNDRTGVFEEDPLYPLLCASKNNCSYAYDLNMGNCPLAATGCPNVQAKRNTRDLLITNHKLFEQIIKNTEKQEEITIENSKKKQGINLLKAELYFFDEAHHLMGYGAGTPDQMTFSLSTAELEALLSFPVPSYIDAKIRSSLFIARDALWETWKNITTDLSHDLDEIKRKRWQNIYFLSDLYMQTLTQRLGKLLRYINAIGVKLNNTELTDSIQRLMGFWWQFRTALEKLNLKDPNCASSLRVSPNGISWVKYTERSFEQDLAKHAEYLEYAGFVSGTLLVGGKPDTFVVETGIDHLRSAIEVPSPYEHKYINLWIPGEDKIKSPIYKREYEQDVINFCKQYVPPYVKEDLGGVLILSTSLARMHAIANAIRPEVEKAGRTLLVQGTQTRTGLVKAFLYNNSPVLVACDSFREGFDAPEDKLTWVILDRLPFRMPGIADFESRANLLRNKNVIQNVREHNINLMLLSLAQSLGRLERSEYDWGTLTILDSRINMFLTPHLEKNCTAETENTNKTTLKELASNMSIDMGKIIQTAELHGNRIYGLPSVHNWLERNKELKIEAECNKYKF